MHLYEINPSDGYPVHVVARTPDDAVQHFVTWRAARGVIDESFCVDRMEVNKLMPDQQAQVRDAFAAGLTGVSHFDEEVGWTFSPPLSVAAGSDQPVDIIRSRRSEMMGLFEFRDPKPVEAFVIAKDTDRALAMFKLYLETNGGDPNTVLWRERDLEDLDEAQQLALEEAATIHREGLVIVDGSGRWDFHVPLGDQSNHNENEDDNED